MAKKNKGIIHTVYYTGWYCSFVRPTIYKKTGHLERYPSIALECLARPSSDARTRLLVGCHVITIGGRHLSTFECQAPKADIGYKVWKSYIKHHNPPFLPLDSTLPPPPLFQGWLNQSSYLRNLLKSCWYFTAKLLCSQASKAKQGKFCRRELSASLPLLCRHATA